MKSGTKRISTTIAAAGVLTLAGCGMLGGGGEPVDHETTTQQLEANATTISERINKSAEFLEESTFVAESYGRAIGSGCSGGSADSGTESPDSPSGSDSMDSSSDCQNDQEAEIAVDTTEYTNQVIEELNDRVFLEDNMERESRKSVIYRAKGRNWCKKEDFVYEDYDTCSFEESDSGTCDSEPQEEYHEGEHQECIDEVNEVGIRIRVTQPTKGNLDFSVLIGPERYNPVDFQLHEELVAVEGDLADIRKSAEHIDATVGGDVSDSLPETMEGRLRGELEMLASDKVRLQAIIKQAVTVAGGEYDISLGRSRPVLGLTVDGGQKRLTGTVDFGTIDAGFPTTYYQAAEQPQDPESDGSGDQTSESTDIEVSNRVHLAGATAELVFDGSGELLTFDNVGLGDSTSWWKMDGEKVLSGDLNPNSGRTFSGQVSPLKSGDQLEVQLSPEIRVDTLLKFKRINDKVDSFSEWLLDDRIRVDFTGEKPTFRFNWEDIEITRGQLQMSSETPDLNVDVQAGQCLVTEETSSESYYHPLRGLKGGQCSTSGS